MKNYLLLILLTANSAVADMSAHEDLEVLAAPKERIVEAPTLPTKERPKAQAHASRSHVPLAVDGNLPAYMLRHQQGQSFSNPVLISENKQAYGSTLLNVGDVIEVLINQNIAAYENSVSPIKAEVSSGNLKGAILVGNATMDRQTKGVFIKFDSIRIGKARTQQIEAIVLSEKGLLGLNGEYQSHYWRYFLAETLANSVAAAADSQTKRNQTVWGFSEIAPSVDTAIKQGVAGAASSTAQRFAERARTIPEYTFIEGPVFTKALVLKEPESKKNN